MPEICQDFFRYKGVLGMMKQANGYLVIGMNSDSFISDDQFETDIKEYLIESYNLNKQLEIQNQPNTIDNECIEKGIELDVDKKIDAKYGPSLIDSLLVQCQRLSLIADDKIALTKKQLMKGIDLGFSNIYMPLSQAQNDYIQKYFTEKSFGHRSNQRTSSTISGSEEEIVLSVLNRLTHG